jgi:hypothetical protein
MKYSQLSNFLTVKTVLLLLDIKEKNKHLFVYVLKVPLFASIVNAHPARLVAKYGGPQDMESPKDRYVLLNFTPSGLQYQTSCVSRGTQMSTSSVHTKQYSIHLSYKFSIIKKLKNFSCPSTKVHDPSGVAAEELLQNRDSEGMRQFVRRHHRQSRKCHVLD